LITNQAGSTRPQTTNAMTTKKESATFEAAMRFVREETKGIAVTFDGDEARVTLTETNLAAMLAAFAKQQR
jgi:hypothetical protein